MRQIVAVVCAVMLLGIAYYGSYLPLRKSQKLIEVMRTLDTLRSVEEFKEAFSRVLDAKSPIGQEELVRHMTNLIPPIVQQNGKQNPELTRQLVEYVETYYAPIITYGRGMSFGQNLYLLGALNELAFIQTQDPRYIERAHAYFSRGLELGPKRPQFLYGMFDIYRIEGNVQKAKELADQITSQWPGDDKTKSAYEDFLKRVNAATSAGRQ